MSRAVLNILVRNASPRGSMCFRCLIFSLSGACELLFFSCVLASAADVLEISVVRGVGGV